MLTEVDWAAFASYCQAYTRWKEAKEFMTQHGTIVKTKSGYWQQVPQVSITQTYSSDKDACSAHFIRTVVLKEIVLGELNKMVAFVKENEDEFIQAAMDNSVQKQSSELAKAKKAMKQAEKRIAELDKLFTRLYEPMYQARFPMNALL